MRTVVEVKTLLGHAKVDDSTLSSTTHVLSLSDPVFPQQVKLMEVNEQIIQELNDNQRLCIRGSKEDVAVLCGVDSSWEVKEAECSNTMLLFDKPFKPSNEDQNSENWTLESREARGFYNTYFELRPHSIRLDHLRHILSNCPYKGPECENDPEILAAQKLTFDELMASAQTSRAELESALATDRAVCIDGYWRMLDFAYLTRVISGLISLLEHNSWSWTAFPHLQAVETLAELEPLAILLKVLAWFAQPVTEGDGELWALKQQEICRFYAEVILRPVGKFKLDDFLETWQQSVPEGMKTDKSQIEGLALMCCDSEPATIEYFDVSQLPSLPQQRMECLFGKQDRWPEGDIVPYLRDLASGKSAMDNLLLKFCRASTVNCTKYFVSRKLQTF